MGLAASQARLLSITQRLSDNELRAQLINNQKMRLSAESSQVSENYINALNKTNLMFANYDSEDNAQSVALTFNNLTAFNQYNNQYGLTNAAGNILISEDEAKYYQAAIKKTDDPLKEFLRLHGIEYTTSYWDTISDQLKDVEGFNDDAGNYNFYTAAELQKMYEGYVKTDGTEISSYDNTIKTDEFVNLTTYADLFAEKLAEIENANKTIGELRTKFVRNLMGSTSYTPASLTGGNPATIASTIANNINANFSSGVNTTDIETELVGLINPEKFAEYYHFTIIDGGYYQAANRKNFNLSGETDLAGDWKLVYNHPVGVIQGKDYAFVKTTDTSKAVGVNLHNTPPSGYTNTTYTGTIPTYHYSDGSTFSQGVKTLSDGTKIIRVVGSDVDETYAFKNISGGKADVYSKVPNKVLNDNTTENTLGLVSAYIQKLTLDIINKLFANGATVNPAGTGCTGFTEEEKALITNTNPRVAGLSEAMENLANLLFGPNANNTTYNYKDVHNLDVILNFLTGGSAQWKASGEQLAGQYEGNDVKFDWGHLQISESTFNAYVLDTIMDLFGEPKYTYLYTNGNFYDDDDATKGIVTPRHGDSDAGAEASWLTNLFNKIQSCGYQVIAKGLANSTEWLQFALENGIVVMEQVTASNDWMGITYTSCSDISEQTAKTEATLAEAEYNKAMRQIEAKDERLDLELKNIDTEHSALQNEYESVKKAMSGNIERNFQMYG